MISRETRDCSERPPSKLLGGPYQFVTSDIMDDIMDPVSAVTNSGSNPEIQSRNLWYEPSDLANFLGDVVRRDVPPLANDFINVLLRSRGTDITPEKSARTFLHLHRLH
jgi:hypothetical protein